MKTECQIWNGVLWMFVRANSVCLGVNDDHIADREENQADATLESLS